MLHRTSLKLTLSPRSKRSRKGCRVLQNLRLCVHAERATLVEASVVTLQREVQSHRFSHSLSLSLSFATHVTTLTSLLQAPSPAPLVVFAAAQHKCRQEIDQFHTRDTHKSPPGPKPCTTCCACCNSASTSCCTSLFCSCLAAFCALAMDCCRDLICVCEGSYLSVYETNTVLD